MRNEIMWSQQSHDAARNPSTSADPSLLVLPSLAAEFERPRLVSIEESDRTLTRTPTPTLDLGDDSVPIEERLKFVEDLRKTEIKTIDDVVNALSGLSAGLRRRERDRSDEHERKLRHIRFTCDGLLRCLYRDIREYDPLQSIPHWVIRDENRFIAVSRANDPSRKPDSILSESPKTFLDLANSTIKMWEAEHKRNWHVAMPYFSHAVVLFHLARQSPPSNFLIEAAKTQCTCESNGFNFSPVTILWKNLHVAELRSQILELPSGNKRLDELRSGAARAKMIVELQNATDSELIEALSKRTVKDGDLEYQELFKRDFPNDADLQRQLLFGGCLSPDELLYLVSPMTSIADPRWYPIRRWINSQVQEEIYAVLERALETSASTSASAANHEDQKTLIALAALLEPERFPRLEALLAKSWQFFSIYQFDALFEERFHKSFDEPDAALDWRVNILSESFQSPSLQDPQAAFRHMTSQGQLIRSAYHAPDVRLLPGLLRIFAECFDDPKIGPGLSCLGRFHDRYRKELRRYWHGKGKDPLQSLSTREDEPGNRVIEREGHLLGRAVLHTLASYDDPDAARALETLITTGVVRSSQDFKLHEQFFREARIPPHQPVCVDDDGVIELSSARDQSCFCALEALAALGSSITEVSAKSLSTIVQNLRPDSSGICSSPNDERLSELAMGLLLHRRDQNAARAIELLCSLNGWIGDVARSFRRDPTSEREKWPTIALVRFRDYFEFAPCPEVASYSIRMNSGDDRHSVTQTSSYQKIRREELYERIPHSLGHSGGSWTQVQPPVFRLN